MNKSKLIQVYQYGYLKELFRKNKKNIKIFWNNAWQIVLNEVQWRQQKTREEKNKRTNEEKKQKSSEHGGRSNGLLKFTSRKSLNEFT